MKDCDRCDGQCRLADCKRILKGTFDYEVIATLCLPYSIDDKEVKNRCEAHKDIHLSEWRQDCSGNIDIDSIGLWSSIAIGLLMVVYFGFIGTVGWYNYKFRRTGQPPIKCPRMCPEALFPRPMV